MKRLTQLVNEGKEPLQIQNNTMNYITVPELKKYLEIAKKILSTECQQIVNWLIDHNDEYISLFTKGDKSKNALKEFYDAGVPSNSDYKALYNSIGKLKKRDRLLEIPVFQTKEQFHAIINKLISPDAILLDLSTPEGKNKVAKQYMPLVKSIAYKRKGMSSLDWDELISAGKLGLAYAIDRYGKKLNGQEDDMIKNTYDDEYLDFDEPSEEEEQMLNKKHIDGVTKRAIAVEKKRREVAKDLEQRTGNEHIDKTASTFGQFASILILNYIIQSERDNGDTVHMPNNLQYARQKEKTDVYNKLRKELRTNKISGEDAEMFARAEDADKGRDFSISGDELSGSGDDEHATSMFDKTTGSSSASSELNKSELRDAWKQVYDAVSKKFDKRDIEIWMHNYGLNGASLISGRDLADQYGLKTPSMVNYIVNRINKWLMQNDEMKELMYEILSMTRECRLEDDHDSIIEVNVSSNNGYKNY